MALTTSQLSASRFSDKFTASPVYSSRLRTTPQGEYASPLEELKKSFAELQNSEVTSKLAGVIAKIEFPDFDSANRLLDSVLNLEVRIGSLQTVFSTVAEQVSPVIVELNTKVSSLEEENRSLREELSKLQNETCDHQAKIINLESTLSELCRYAAVDSPDRLLPWAVETCEELKLAEERMVNQSEQAKAKMAEQQAFTMINSTKSISFLKKEIVEIKQLLSGVKATLAGQKAFDSTERVCCAIENLPELAKEAANAHVLTVLRDHQHSIDSALSLNEAVLHVRSSQLSRTSQIRPNVVLESSE